MDNRNSQTLYPIPMENYEKPRSYRFDIFKGVRDDTGKVHRLKSVGSAYLLEGFKTYTVYLKTFLNDVFYMLPEQKRQSEADFVILTREPSRTPGRKYFWNSVGEGTILTGENAGFVQLSWDLLGVDDIFMTLHPKEGSFEAEVTQILKEEVLLKKAA